MFYVCVKYLVKKNNCPANLNYYTTAKDKYNQKNYIKFKTESIKSCLYDYSDVVILVSGDITVTAKNDIDAAFKNCAPFSTCKAKINNVFFDEANHFHIAMLM